MPLSVQVIAGEGTLVRGQLVPDQDDALPTTLASQGSQEDRRHSKSHGSRGMAWLGWHLGEEKHEGCRSAEASRPAGVAWSEDDHGMWSAILQAGAATRHGLLGE